MAGAIRFHQIPPLPCTQHEAAALNQKLKMLGHDAAKELDDKIIGLLRRQ